MVGIDSLNPGGVGQAFLPGVTGLDTCTIRASSESPKAREARFWKVAQSFQAIFIRQLLSSMRQGELGQDLLGASHGSKMVREMHDDLVAEKVAEGDRGGLARIIYDDLVRLEVNDTDKARARLEQKENAPRDGMPLSEKAKKHAPISLQSERNPSLLLRSKGPLALPTHQPAAIPLSLGDATVKEHAPPVENE